MSIDKIQQFADVVIPGQGGAIGVFTYKISETISSVKPGMLALVPFRNRRVYALVITTHSNTPNFQVKPILRVFYDEQFLYSWQIELMNWMKNYYFSSHNKLIKLFVHNKILQRKAKESMDLVVQLKEKNPMISVSMILMAKPQNISKSASKRLKVINFIKQKKEIVLQKLVKEMGVTSGFLKNMNERGELQILEKQVPLLSYEAFGLEEKMKLIIEKLRFGEVEYKTLKDILRFPLKKALDEMLKRDWIEMNKKVIQPKRKIHELTKGFLKALNISQKTIVEQIICSNKKRFLLHGVTGAGKTEVYLHLITHYVNEGKQAILLVPEISLTPQILQYFSRIFNDELAVLHSRISEGQRIKEWFRIKRGLAKVVIGSRSALFAPVRNPGIIIIDEEHEWTYKQENNPRYHARKVAEKICDLTDSKLLLGSATPDIESYYRSTQDEYKLLELKERVKDGVVLPTVSIVDLREEFLKKNYSIFSELLKIKIADRLKKKEQIILFLNKRGKHSAVVCRECGKVMKCSLCDVSYTYHQLHGARFGKLICHCCGLLEDPPLLCPFCKSANIKYVGIGTQKIESEVRKYFPDARVFRADKDTTTGRDAYENMYRAVHNREIDILIGTQMVTKGFDFPDVTLVGIILADTTLYIPDFRSSERMLQLIMQVGGRAGRSLKKGEVVIQTYCPEHIAFKAAKTHDYGFFYNNEILSRKNLSYPPYSNLIKIEYVHPDKVKCFNEIERLKNNILECIKNQNVDIQVYSAPALIPKKFGKYHFQILLKGKNLGELLTKIIIPKDFRIDVDPAHTV